MALMHQIYQVKNQQVTLTLPKDFSAEQVEIIVLPVTEEKEMAGGKTAVIQRFLSLDTSDFTTEQYKAYMKTCGLLQQGGAPDKPRTAGLFAGLVHISDDFDDPLPDEHLFWGEETDEYGMTIPQ